MLKYQLVPYTEQDYEFIYDTKKVSYYSYVEQNFGKWDEQAQQKYFEGFMEERSKHILIIMVDGKKAGFTEGCEITPYAYEQGNICLLKPFQNKGIGSDILINVCKTHKNHDVYIRVFKQNRAKALYERLGFEVYEESFSHYKMVRKASLNSEE